jgi:hypothetical protein
MEDRLLRIYMFLPVFALVLGIIYVFAAEDSYRYECQDPANWEQAYCQPPLCEAVAACTKDLLYNGETVVNNFMESGIDLTPEPVEEPIEELYAPIEEILDEVKTEEQANE